MHVVQVKGFPPQANMPNPLPRNPPRLANVVLLEHLSRGSLHKMLCTVTGSGATIPNRVLWLMFRCRKSCPGSPRTIIQTDETWIVVPVVEACIALEYPPRRDPLRNMNITGNGVNVATGEPYDERVFALPGPPPPPFQGHGKMDFGSGLVHFDIDPCNSKLAPAPANRHTTDS